MNNFSFYIVLVCFCYTYIINSTSYCYCKEVELYLYELKVSMVLQGIPLFARLFNHININYCCFVTYILSIWYRIYTVSV